MNKFEVGKAYEHNSGMQMYICCSADNTIGYGKCLIAENGWNREKLKQRELELAQEDDDVKRQIGWLTAEKFSPVSEKEAAIENWFEIPVEQFVENNFVASYITKL